MKELTIEEKKQIVLNKIKHNTINELREKFNKLILAKYSYEDQINAFSEIAKITSLALKEERQLSSDEKTRLEELYLIKNYIDTKREEYHSKIGQINSIQDI